MTDVHTIMKGGMPYAHVFSKALTAPEGVRFLTPQDSPLQIGLMERKKGYLVKPHKHPSTERKLHTTPEFLYVESGSILVKIFTDAWEPIEEHTLNDGDSMLLLRGGHSVQVLKDSRFFEVKQGPFVGAENDKAFPPVL